MTTFRERKLDLDLQVINVVNQNVTKSWKHAASYAVTLNNTTQTLPEISVFLNLSNGVVNDDADWIGLSFKMPFKTRYHASKRWRFVILSSILSSFSSAGGISAILFRVSRFVWRPTLSTKQHLVSFSSLCSGFLALQKSLNRAFQRNKPWTSHLGFKSGSETRAPRLSTSEVSSFAFVIGRTPFFH